MVSVSRFRVLGQSPHFIWEYCQEDIASHRTLIVTVAYISTLVTCVWSAVDKTLCIMHIAIASSTSGSGGVGRISHVDEDEATSARQVVPVPHRLIAAYRPSSDGVAELLVHNDVVRPSYRQLVEVTSEVLLCEDGWASWVQVEELLHVEDLNAVLDSLGADDDQIAERPDLPPSRADGVVLGKSAEVDQLAL